MQKEVSLYPALGKSGQEVAVGTAVYTPLTYISDGTVKAGHFAFAKATDEVGANSPVASATGSAGDKVLGFVHADFTSMLQILEDASEVYPHGFAVSIARRGDFYLTATGAVTAGKAVLCDPTTGAITFGEADATNDTGWRVLTEAKAEGDIIVISHRGRD